MKARLPVLLPCLALVFAFSAVAGAPAHADELGRARKKLTEDIKKVWAGRVLRRGVTAVYVVDAATGLEVYSVHADDKLNPASNVKLISTATVLENLGPTWRYTTRLFGAAGGVVGPGH